MLQHAFSAASPYRKRAKLLAVAWTLLILFLCFLPAAEVPDVNIPFADKWVHFLLFGVFALLWDGAYPGGGLKSALLVLAAGVAFGWLVEELQGLLAFLGRSRDYRDALADAVGALLGTGLFCSGRLLAERKNLSS